MTPFDKDAKITAEQVEKVVAVNEPEVSQADELKNVIERQRQFEAECFRQLQRSRANTEFCDCTASRAALLTRPKY